MNRFIGKALKKVNENSFIELREEEKKHAKVKRVKDGEICEVVLDKDIFLCSYDKELNMFKVIEKIAKLEEGALRVYIGLPVKLQSFEEALDFVSQTGAYEIVPLITERSFKDLNKIEQKRERWQKIIQEAIKQSRSKTMTRLKEPVFLKDIKEKAFFLDSFSPENIITKTDLSFSKSFIIGPEGGFSKEEVFFMKERGFKSLSLGENILKTQLASFFITLYANLNI